MTKNARRAAHCTTALLAAAALTSGCGAPPPSDAEDTTTDAVGAERPATPSRKGFVGDGDRNWTSGVSTESVALGTDVDGSNLYPCRADYLDGTEIGETKPGWGVCVFTELDNITSAAPFETLVASWFGAVDGTIPPLAEPIGTDVDGTRLYSCRASFNGSEQLGVLRTGYAGCLIPWGHAVYTETTYQVLGSSPFGFALSPGFSDPRGLEPKGAMDLRSLVGGTDSNGALLYPCVALYEGALRVGKMQQSWNVCDLPYEGGEVAVADYTTLLPRLAPVGSSDVPYVAGIDASNEGGDVLGICTVPGYNGSNVIGKYDAWKKLCWIFVNAGGVSMSGPNVFYVE